jgi:hypothetical protein
MYMHKHTHTHGTEVKKKTPIRWCPFFYRGKKKHPILESSVPLHSRLVLPKETKKKGKIERKKEQEERAPHFAEELGALVLAHPVRSSARLNVIALWR